jgi:hypothetical protein
VDLNQSQLKLIKDDLNIGNATFLQVPGRDLSDIFSILTRPKNTGALHRP